MANSIPPRKTRSSGLILAAGGGLGFWVANFAISLTPVAAEYRAGLSISYGPMLLEALLGGLVIGCVVGYTLLNCYATIPFRSPILKSLLLSAVALIAVTVLIEVPGKLLGAVSDPGHYLLVGTVFNGLRILALGATIGYLYGHLVAGPNAQPNSRRSEGPAPSSR
jgi:hypothetical protein